MTQTGEEGEPKMAQAHAKPQHDYHLVNPSPWPIIGAIGGFTLAIGVLMYFMSKKAGTPELWYIIPGLALVVLTMFGWWRDVIIEAHDGHETPVVQLHLRYGMILFIASEVMFFVAWFWAYFDVALFPNDITTYARTEVTGGVWPPITSGTTATWAHHAMLHNDRKGLAWGLACTVVLGALFTSLQIFEYMHAGFGFSNHIYGSTFYMATGFHGFHVIVGTIFLLVCLFRALQGHFSPKQHFGFEAAAWYWHFVDVVWLFLFTCIYVWGAGTNFPAH